MNPDTITIYTDASYSRSHSLAVLASVVYQNENEHEEIPLSDKKINLLQIKESNNIRAEVNAALFALRTCTRDSKIQLYSDCRTLIELPRRRKKLEALNFISQSKKTPLANADLYKEFYKLYDTFHLELIWLKGHTAKKKQTKLQKNFSHLDNVAREHLRQLVRK